jgi:hypothetical protein
MFYDVLLPSKFFFYFNSAKGQGLCNSHGSIIGYQCCGAGIQCLFEPWIRDPGWVKN